jgi:hypothetical protein
MTRACRHPNVVKVLGPVYNTSPEEGGQVVGYLMPLAEDSLSTRIRKASRYGPTTLHVR